MQYFLWTSPRNSFYLGIAYFTNEFNSCVLIPSKILSPKITTFLNERNVSVYERFPGIILVLTNTF